MRENIADWSYMSDEFPEQGPNEFVQLNCMPGKKPVLEPQIDLSLPDEQLTFGPLGSNMEDEHGNLSLPAAWVKTQQELRREYKRKLSEKDIEDAAADKAPKKKATKLSQAAREAKARNRLKHRKKREALREFRREALIRQTEGYSKDQMLLSHMPDIGRQVTVSQAEVKEFMKQQASGFFCQALKLLLVVSF